MKQKPASVTPSRIAEKAVAATAAASPKSKAPSRKPLFESAVEAVGKLLKPKPAKAPAAGVEGADSQVIAHRKKYTVPPILLEGDAPEMTSASGPGEKYSLGATPPRQRFSGGELPEAYGTKKLFLAARDPHWLYAHWDLTREQQLELNGAAADGHLILRIYIGKIEGHPTSEIHVHPESRHWFAHVEQAGNSYAAELGYYSVLGKWTRVAVSSGTVTPPDAVAAENDAEFATIPFDFPFARLMQIIEEAVRDNRPLALAIEELRRHGHPDLPRFSSSGVSSIAPAPSATPGPTRVWTPEQERALAKIISIDETRRVWMGSLEITELIRRRLTHDVSSPTTAFGGSSPGISSASSPFGGGASASSSKGFWFNVNAELIIYGATEPGATVTLGGHAIKLRADGTFSFRFALPDGNYELPAVAVAAEGNDTRTADLKFSRATQYLGAVEAALPDPALQPPVADKLPAAQP